jgi:hypothetical protein
MGFNSPQDLLLNEFENFELIDIVEQMIQQREDVDVDVDEDVDENSNFEFEDEDGFDQIDPDIFDQLIRGINEDFDEFFDEEFFNLENQKKQESTFDEIDLNIFDNIIPSFLFSEN